MCPRSTCGTGTRSTRGRTSSARRSNARTWPSRRSDMSTGPHRHIAQIRRNASPITIVCSVLLLVDLFLPWHHAAVNVPGVVHVEATSMGWRGAGAIAGLLALAALVVELRARTGPAPRRATLVRVAGGDR